MYSPPMSAQLWVRGGVAICLCVVGACRGDSQDGVVAAGSASVGRAGACDASATHGSLGGASFCINLFGGREVYRDPAGAALSYSYGPPQEGARRVVVIQAAVMDFDNAVGVLLSDERIVRNGKRPDGGAYAIAQHSRQHVIQHVIRAVNGSLICRGITDSADEIDSIGEVCGSLRME